MPNINDLIGDQEESPYWLREVGSLISENHFPGGHGSKKRGRGGFE